MTKCKPANIPTATDVKLFSNDESNSVDKGLHQSIIGSLLNLSTATRSDFVGVLCVYPSVLARTHLTAVKKVLQYLKGTQEPGVTY